MGTIIGRTRKDGSKAFVAQIVIKKAGSIVHREAETFDRKQAANAWIVKREAAPGSVESAASAANRYCAKPADATAPECSFSSMKDCRASLKGKAGSCYKF